MIGITDLPLRDTGGGHTSGTGLVQLTKTIDIAPKVPVAGTAVIDATACTVKEAWVIRCTRRIRSAPASGETRSRPVKPLGAATDEYDGGQSAAL